MDQIKGLVFGVNFGINHKCLYHYWKGVKLNAKRMNLFPSSVRDVDESDTIIWHGVILLTYYLNIIHQISHNHAFYTSVYM